VNQYRASEPAAGDVAADKVGVSEATTVPEAGAVFATVQSVNLTSMNESTPAPAASFAANRTRPHPEFPAVSAVNPAHFAQPPDVNVG